MKRFLSVLVTLVLLGAALAGCGNGSGEAVAGVDDMAASSADYRDTLRVTLEGEPDTLFPHESTMDPAITVERQIFNQLLYRSNDDKNEIVGELAERWEYTNDVTIRFYLRDNVLFSNGDKLTADDVKFSLELGNTNPKVHYYDQIDRVDVVDPLTVDVVTKAPNAAILAHVLMVRGGAIMSKAHFDQVGGMTGYSRDPVGTGPYKLKEWREGENIQLEARDDFQPIGQITKAATPNLVFNWSTEASNRAIEVETDSSDISLQPDPKDFDRMTEVGLNVQTNKSYHMLGVNVNEANVPDIKLRQAIAYAIDYDAMQDAIYGTKYSSRARGIVPELMEGGYAANWTIEYDLEKAKQLVIDAGYPDGVELEIMAINRTDTMIAAEVLQNQLRQAGINTTVVTGAEAPIKERFYQGDYQIMPDMNQWSHGDICRPLHFWNNFEPAFAIPEPDYTKLHTLYDSGFAELDPVKRAEIYGELQQIILDHWNFFPVCSRVQAYVTTANVEGFYPTSMVNPLLMNVKVKK